MRAPATLLVLDLPCEVASLAAVGPPLAALGLPRGAGAREDLRLAVWELLANAFLHSGGGPEDLVGLRIEDYGGRLRVEVSDPGPGFAPGPCRLPGHDAIGGRGLAIVERLSACWGVERAGSNRVWCELPAAA